MVYTLLLLIQTNLTECTRYMTLVRETVLSVLIVFVVVLDLLSVYAANLSSSSLREALSSSFNFLNSPVTFVSCVSGFSTETFLA